MLLAVRVTQSSVLLAVLLLGERDWRLLCSSPAGGTADSEGYVVLLAHGGSTTNVLQ